MSAIPEIEYHEHASLAGRKRAAREETNRVAREETSENNKNDGNDEKKEKNGKNRAGCGETTRASLAGARQAQREETTRAREKTDTELRPLSPYTIQNLDAAIAHLEVAMNADQGMAIFGQSYWHGRVLELRSTPGIMHAQERRLLLLMDRFEATGQGSR